MSVLILAEHDSNKLKAATHHLVSAARHWQRPVHVLVVGRDTAVPAQEAAKISGVDQVLRCDAPHLAQPLAEDVAAIIAGLGADHHVILAAHTAFGKNILPRAAALLDVAMLSDVIAIVGPDTYERPIYAGNVHATVQSTDAIQVLTVRASRFDPAPRDGNAPVSSLDAPAATQLARVLGEDREHSDLPELSSAKTIISGGRALGSAERFESVLKPLAQKLGASLGATRAAVDAGYAPNEIQVGQTGTIVAPDLYFAVGVSGAIQHLAGIKDSKVIVAINHDPEAPIFEVADYGWVTDLFEAVPALTAALAESHSTGVNA